MTRQPPSHLLKTISSQALLTNIRALIKKERELTLEILQHLQEVERRSLYAALGYSSLFEYCTKELNYSEGAAQRRISSMRLLKEVPNLELKVKQGTLSLSTLAQAQVFFRKEEINTKEEKEELLNCLENKSTREVERELISRAKEPLKHTPERLRRVSLHQSELKILVDDKTLENLTELKNLVAHSHPYASIKDLFEVSLQIALQELRPKASKKATPAPAPNATKARTKLEPELKRRRETKYGKEAKPNSVAKVEPEAKEASSTIHIKKPTRTKASSRSRYISRELKRQVWARDKGECSYIHPESKRKCGSKHGLEFDHIVPFAVGGESTCENLRLRCRVHNQLAAITSFGHEKMEAYVPRIR